MLRTIAAFPSDEAHEQLQLSILRPRIRRFLIPTIDDCKGPLCQLRV